MRKFILVVLIVIVFSSCDENRVYEKNADFENGQWLVTDKPEFEFQISDTVSRYNIYCNIRNSVSYPYSRLFFNYDLKDSTGNSIQKKLMTTTLFDQKTGEPQGDSGLGDIYDQRVPLLQNYSFKNRGMFKIDFQQYMRKDTLAGIFAVGVRLEKVPKNP
jgi:gliding motility-associated lipoprotein GldH